MHSAHGKKFATVFFRVQPLVHLFSTSFYVTFFISWMVSQQPVTLTTPHLTSLTNERFGNKRNRVLLRTSFSINSGKGYKLFSVNDAGNVYLENIAITFENNNELLGIVLDSKLFFEDHIYCLCKKSSQKLNALARIAPDICPDKRKTVMKAFGASQFGCVIKFGCFIIKAVIIK